MSISQEELTQILHTSFPTATEILVTDMMGDDDHYTIKIRDPIFKGKTIVQQHRYVHQSLKGITGGSLHACILDTASE